MFFRKKNYFNFDKFFMGRKVWEILKNIFFQKKGKSPKKIVFVSVKLSVFKKGHFQFFIEISTGVRTPPTAV